MCVSFGTATSLIVIWYCYITSFRLLVYYYQVWSTIFYLSACPDLEVPQYLDLVVPYY